MKRYSIPAMAALLAILVSLKHVPTIMQKTTLLSLYVLHREHLSTPISRLRRKRQSMLWCASRAFTTQRQQNPYGNQGGGYDPFGMFDFFFGPQQPRQQQPRQQQRNSEPVQSGLGSGVIISDDGYIVTNNHVIDGADKLEVLLNDNATYEARVIGTDEATDLALIKIDAEKLSPITFGDSEQVKIGEWVLAVGNPFGFNSTVTALRSSVQRHVASARTTVETERWASNRLSRLTRHSTPATPAAHSSTLRVSFIGVNSAIYSNT